MQVILNYNNPSNNDDSKVKIARIFTSNLNLVLQDFYTIYSLKRKNINPTNSILLNLKSIFFDNSSY